MNANELAEGILAIEERIFLTKKEHQLFQNSATMLRQQQEEIEALKSKTLTEDTECQYCKQGCIRCDARKLLTDEEIKELWKPLPDTKTYDSDILNFARAILRKASEK